MSASESRPCVFFDRDGIVNQAPPPEMYYVLRWEDFHIQPGFLDALRVARDRGYAAVVATNQKCVARGLISMGALDAIHQRFREKLSEEDLHVQDIMVCPHGDGECDCRKPQPGLLLRAARRHHLDLSRSWMIGDSERDILAGRAAGCHTVLIGGGAGGTVADYALPHIDDLPAFLERHLA